MPHLSRLFVLLTALVSLSPASAAGPATTPAATRAIESSRSATLQGDGRAALQALDAVPADQYALFDAEYRACMRGRFDRSTPPWVASGIEDPFARDVLAAYQAYWWHALVAPADREAQSARLLRHLRALLGTAGDGALDFETLEPILSKALLERGYHALEGVTAPLHELMLWRTQAPRQYRVALPEGPRQVTVYLLDDFVAWGWLNYARCGQGSTGGWTTDEAIYAVRPGYPDLDAEKFRVSLLGHEAQHFADKQRWSLEDWELEYRAKLTELVLAKESSHDLLRKFGQSHGADTSSPHAYADERVAGAVRRQLGDAGNLDLAHVPLQDLQRAARAALLADSESRGASTVKQGDPSQP